MKKLVYSGIFGHVTCRESDLALAVTSDGNINQLGDGDNGDLSVQDDAEKRVRISATNLAGQFIGASLRREISRFKIILILLTLRPC